MSKLFGFGDSFTEGHILDVNFQIYKDWKILRGGNLPPVWIDLLGEKLEMEVFNYACGGLGNDEIFHRFCEHVNEIQKGDIVMINWTYMERFRWASVEYNNDGTPRIGSGPNNTHPYWKRLSSHPEDGKHISESTRKEIVANRVDLMNRELIYNYEKIIDRLAKSMGFEVFYWSIENELIYHLPKEILHQKKYILHDKVEYTKHRYRNVGGDFCNMIYNNGGQNIIEETEHKLHDFHLGESGHRVQFELFYEYITRFRRQLY